MKAAAIAALYVLGAVVFLWPMPASMGTHVWGDRFDAWTTLWLMDHLHRHLADGTLQAQTNEILFPVGYNLWSFGHAALQILGVGLMFCGVGLVPAYNALLIGGLATSGLAAHLLGRELSGSHAGGFVAGVVFSTTPYLYGEGAAGCIELVSAGFLPLFAWSLVRLTRAPTMGRAAIAAVILAVVGPFNWYYTLFCGMLGVGFAAWQALAGRTRAAGLAFAAMGVAAAIDAPLIPLVRRETPTRPPLSAEVYADAEAWTRKHEFSNGTVPLEELDVAVLEEQDALQVMENSTTLSALLRNDFTVNPLRSTPGAIAFAAGVAGAILTGRRGLGWAALAVGATILTLGPFLRVGDTPPLSPESARWPLPYAYAYQWLPFFSKAYRPYRIGVVTLTACAALAASAVPLRRPAWMSVGVLIFAGVAIAQPWWTGEHPASRPIADATIPALYAKMAALPEGGVVEVPLQYQPLSVANARFQYNQVAHRHPVVNCNQLIRRTDLVAFRDWVLKNDFVATLVDLARREPPLSFSAKDLVSARAQGLRWVVMHTRAEADDVRLAGDQTAADLVGEPAATMLASVLSPVLQDQDGVVYEIPAEVEDATASWTWTGDDVADVSLPLDAAGYDVPIRVADGKELPLWSGPGRRLSMWARYAAGRPELHVRDEAGERIVPLELTPGDWQRVSIELHGTATVTLRSPGGAAAWLTRVQGLRDGPGPVASTGPAGSVP